MSKEIPLTGKRGRGKFAIVDDCDFERVAPYLWHIDTEGYARTHINRQVAKLHRYIMNALPGQIVDHANGNVLDNRRCNLRFATKGQNKMNANCHKNSIVGVKGVSQRETGKYQARIQSGGKQVHIGCFFTLRAAAQAYNDAAIKAFGEYALLNDLSQLPDETEPTPPTPTSNYYCVHWSKQRQKWRVSTVVSGRSHELGFYKNETDAACAYDSFVKEHNLDRPLNFPNT